MIKCKEALQQTSKWCAKADHSNHARNRYTSVLRNMRKYVVAANLKMKQGCHENNNNNKAFLP